MGKWIGIWLVSLIAVAGLASVMVRAQLAPFSRPKAELADAPILSGADFGFRVEGTQNGRAVGTLMVRVKGQWVEAGFSGTFNRVTD